jgi:hypothetical protein
MNPQSDAAMGLLPGTTGAVDWSSAAPVAGDYGLSQGTGTGQHGITPLMGNGGTMTDAVNGVWAWLNTPFQTPMSPYAIGLLVGVVIVAVIVWNLLIYHIRIAAETL